MPLPNSGEYAKEYRLNTSGLVSSYTDPDGVSQTFTYNADGTLARLEYRDPSYPEENSTSTLTWQDGNIVSISTIDGRDNETMTFTYTEHLNPWNGIDMGAFLINDAEESAMLLGISGTTVKNLPASRQDGNSTTTYTYTFDAEGRVSTIVTEENWQDGGGSGSDRTEYTLHYGPQTVAKPDYIPYLAKQEVVDEGTLPYIFWEDNPDEKQYGDKRLHLLRQDPAARCPTAELAKKPNTGRSTSTHRLRRVRCWATYTSRRTKRTTSGSFRPLSTRFRWVKTR